MDDPEDSSQEHTSAKCSNCGHDLVLSAQRCPNCGYAPKPNYWLSLILFGVVVVPASMAACSVGAIAYALSFRPDDPNAFGPGIMAMFSIWVGPIALGITWGLIRWQFEKCLRWKSNIKGLLPISILLVPLCTISGVILIWSAFKGLVLDVLAAFISFAIAWDIVRYFIKDRQRASAPESQV